MRGHDRRHDIMQAAERLFKDRRFHEITLDEVAQLARVGKGTIYRHFADKDDLFFQTATSGFDDMCALLRREVPGDAPFEQRLLSACEQITAFFSKRRDLFRMMEMEQGRIEPSQKSLLGLWRAKRQGLVAAVAAILEQGREAGRIRADLVPEVAANLLLGMLRTRSRDLDDVPEAQRRVELVLDLFLTGATARPNHAQPQTNSE